MTGLILSAGKGTRLGKLTKDVPKPMIEIAGKPVLEHLVEYMEKYGISPIITNLHYLPLKIMEYFGERLLYTYEPELLGEEGTIESLSYLLEKDFTVVMNGDTLTDLNPNAMFRLSGGRSIRYMDGEIYAGTKILSPLYFRGDKSFVDYRDSNAHWFDIGTPSGLREARKAYE